MHGVMHGQVTFTFSDGGKYVGEFKDGEPHGQGTKTWAAGEKYVGEWKDGVMHGQGTKTWAERGEYVGEWKDNKMHGQGTQTWASGNKYVGEWKDGKRHGQGTVIRASGNKYVGQYRLGVKWDGIEYSVAGEVRSLVSDGMPAPACDGRPVGGWGAGFSVNQYHVVTNAHVLYCCKKVTVYEFESCSGGEEATVVATEQKSDLGLLRLDTPTKHYATLRSGKELQLGEAVLTYDRKPKVNGCPQYDVGQGSVTALDWMPDDSRLMVHDSPTSSGSSGGPALDISGYAVGVTQGGTWHGASGSSFSIKHHLLKAFLTSNNVEYKTAPSTEELSLSEIKEKSDKFTVIIKCIR